MERIPLKIERFIRTAEGSFEPLALELFKYQFDFNLPYQAYCKAQGLTPDFVQRWQDIPAVPVKAFRSSALATFPLGQAAAIFESSATTTGIPSRHYLRTLTYYEASLKAHFKHAIAPSGQTAFLILTPPPAEAPRSSLTWMMDVVKRTWGGPGSDYFIQRGRLDEPRLMRTLKKAEESGSPVMLLGTTIAFLSFFDYADKTGEKFHLALGSQVMDTGGMKTQKRQITRPEFVQKAGEILGIPEAQCVNEYGMCELGSQFYGHGSSSYLNGPFWCRTLVIDSATGQAVPEGTPGLLRHFDLANVDSILAIQTEDVGYAQKDGFVLQGRDPNAEVKGCSIEAEVFLR